VISSKIRLPKWATVAGGVAAALAAFNQVTPIVQNYFPSITSNHAFHDITGMVGMVGAILAVYGTPYRRSASCSFWLRALALSRQSFLQHSIQQRRPCFIRVFCSL
jgi:hypothetical protein